MKGKRMDVINELRIQQLGIEFQRIQQIVRFPHRKQSGESDVHLGNCRAYTLKAGNSSIKIQLIYNHLINFTTSIYIHFSGLRIQRKYQQSVRFPRMFGFRNSRFLARFAQAFPKSERSRKEMQPTHIECGKTCTFTSTFHIQFNGAADDMRWHVCICISSEFLGRVCISDRTCTAEAIM